MGLYGRRQHWNDFYENMRLSSERDDERIKKLKAALQRIREIAEGEGDSSQRMEAVRTTADLALSGDVP